MPNDWDITTSAKPDEIKEAVFAAGLPCIDTGIAHGTVTALVDHVPFEVTTYRADGAYSDGRHPDSVEFLDRIDGDLARRDFTVNSMAFNPRTGLVDHFGGIDDLNAGILRAVGNPVERFTEDALRIVRGMRFAAIFGFEIEDETAAAIHELRHLLNGITVERIWVEFSGLLCGEYAVPVLRKYADVVFEIIPELEPELGFDQHNNFHKYDVWEHTLHTLGAAPTDMDATVRFALLLHDIGKPQCLTFDDQGRGHAYGHEKVGEPIAADICRRLKLSRAQREAVAYYVRWHMFSIPDTTKSMRRFLVKHGPERAQTLFDIRRCDKIGLGTVQAPESKLNVAFARAEQLMEEQLNAQPVFGVRDLAVSGEDVIELGVPQGPAVGEMLNELLRAVVDDELPNERDALLEYARSLM